MDDGFLNWVLIVANAVCAVMNTALLVVGSGDSLNWIALLANVGALAVILHAEVSRQRRSWWR